MANSLTVASQQSTANRWIRAVAAAVVIVLLVASLGVLWVSRQARTRAHADIQPDLLSIVNEARVPKHLALLMLADYPPEQVWQEPLRRGEWDGALAMWLFGPVRSDRVSIDSLLAMAAAQGERNPDAAATCLLAAADVIRLSPELSDRERAELIIEVGESMEALGLEAAAVTEWRQASILAHYGPGLPAMVRSTLLFDLATAYERVGASRLAARARESSAQVGAASGILAVPGRIVLDDSQLPEQPAELLLARDQRRSAAEQTVRELGAASEEAAYASLRDALSAEGLLHRAWMAEQLRAGHPRDVQAALLLYHINWLQRERMLASGMGGDSFPTWAERQGQIEAALHDTWNALELVRMDQSILEGVQERATLVQRDWWATRLVQERLTRDPALDVSVVISSMVPNNADQAGNASLRLDWVQGRFWRIPREYVGMNTLPE